MELKQEIYTVDQLAHELSRSPRTIWNWVKNGNLPKGKKISYKSHYWTRSEIEEFLRNREGNESARVG